MKTALIEKLKETKIDYPEIDYEDGVNYGIDGAIEIVKQTPIAAIWQDPSMTGEGEQGYFLCLYEFLDGHREYVLSYHSQPNFYSFDPIKLIAIARIVPPEKEREASRD